MFTRRSSYLLVALNVFLTACSSVSVTTDYDRATSFDQYRTYTLAPSDENIPLSPSSEAALRDSLRVNLAAHNITEAPKDADLHVVRHISTKDKVVVYPGGGAYGGGMPYAYGRYGYWSRYPANLPDVEQYTEGTLILDFVDAKTQKLVFRGIGTGTVSDPETNAERIREAVEKIVLKFPKTVLH
ncbi:MAG: DUF4136 domain-containing protein [Gammaproteobacteria bacterium]